MSNRYPTAEEFLKRPYDPLIERRFFESVSLPNRTFKSTHEHRLDDVNIAALPYMLALPVRPLNVLDVAASSGISTVEWFEFLGSQKLDFQMTATDMVVKASLLRVGPLAAVVDSKERFLHIDMAGIGMRASVNSLRRHLVAARTAIFSALFKIMRGRISRQSIELISRRFAANGKITMQEEDLFAPNHAAFVHAFHVIRAANILNRSYFSKDEIVRILSNLKERLVNGGLLIVCRTDQESVNSGTIYRLEQDALIPLTQIGRGSEIGEFTKSVSVLDRPEGR